MPKASKSKSKDNQAAATSSHETVRHRRDRVPIPYEVAVELALLQKALEDLRVRMDSEPMVFKARVTRQGRRNPIEESHLLHDLDTSLHACTQLWEKVAPSVSATHDRQMRQRFDEMHQIVQQLTERPSNQEPSSKIVTKLEAL